MFREACPALPAGQSARHAVSPFGGVAVADARRLRGEEYVTRRIYDTIRDHTPVAVFPREVDYAEWEVLRRYPLLNWNMGMVYRLVERDERIYPQGELARRTIGLTGDKGNYGIEGGLPRRVAGRDGRAVRQRIARGFYGRVAGSQARDPEDGYDVVTTLDLDLQDVADKALRRQARAAERPVGHDHRDGRPARARSWRWPTSGRNADGSFAEQGELRPEPQHGSRDRPSSLATMLTLLDDARMPVTTVYDTHNGDPVKIGPARNIRDSHRGDREIDFRRAVASSSNVYFAEAVWGPLRHHGAEAAVQRLPARRACIWARPSDWSGSANAPRRSPPTGRFRPGRHAGEDGLRLPRAPDSDPDDRSTTPWPTRGG